MAARRNKAKDNMIAWLAARHARPHALHHARALVAQRQRKLSAHFTEAHMLVAVADARSNHAHQHLALAGFVQFNALNLIGVSVGIDNGSPGLHLLSSLRYYGADYRMLTLYLLTAHAITRKR